MDGKVSKQDKFVNAMPMIGILALAVVGLLMAFVL